MSPSAQKVLQDALALPDEARADLAAALLESLDRGHDQEVEAAWSEEIARRLREYDSGAVQKVPWETAREMIFGPRDGAPRR